LTSLRLPDRLPCSLDEADALLACIRNRDAKGAQKVSHPHVRNAAGAALGVFQQQSESSPPTTGEAA
jgi:DNA-binding FadR family transcriptional regulator